MDISALHRRKKRRTRKYLDEIRKRAQIPKTSNHLLVQDSKVVVKEVTKGNTTNHTCITMDRLTLKALPKTIISETIIRPTLADTTLKQNSDRSILKNTNMAWHDAANKNKENYSNLKGIDNDNGDITKGSYDGHILSILSDTKGSGRICENAPVSLSPEIAKSKHRYELYKEFMNEISTYLMQNSSGFFNDHFKDPKTRHQCVYLDKCIKGCKNNISHSFTVEDLDINPLVHASNVIVQNPVEYIREAHAAQRFGTESRASCSTGSSELSLTSANVSPEPVSLRSAPPTAALYNTPDYVYYPHKLAH